MIKKSILLFLILFALYEIGIRAFDVKWDTSQNDKSANLINAQDFIYNTGADELFNDTVIVGSSVSRKLITEELGANYHNLAFNAWGSFDGLDLLARRNARPACILVEMNFVGEQDVKEGIRNSLEPVSYYSNSFFKSLQLKNQPVGMLVGSLKMAMKDKMEAAKNKKRENLDLYNYTRDMAKAQFMKGISDSALQNRFMGLKKLVDHFTANGVKIIFFEIPLDSTLENTTLLENNRKYFHRFFPDEKYAYITLPGQNDFVYSDAVHLMPASALDYTHYLRTQIADLHHQNKTL